ncbi:MAG: glycine cleavage system aminomethyltransferase GcvT [Acetobacterales bacterium]
MAETRQQDLLQTPLAALHRSLGARMVPFAGYEMPVQYPAGIIAEHNQTRQSAGLFDVSHMGQARLRGGNAAEALELLVPGDIRALKPGRQRYTMLTNDKGGIRDDLMVANTGEDLFLVVNAACKGADFAHIRTHMPKGVELEEQPDRALVALQGPKAAAVLARLSPPAAEMRFMDWRALEIAGIPCTATRSGYTGEDGYEISVAGDRAEELAGALLEQEEVGPIGLGARDTLRLEAGLCLYGHDIDETTTPVEADLVWTISKRRRSEGGFAGAETILRQLSDGPPRRRVGFRIDGRAPAREGAAVTDAGGTEIGTLTSGGFAPTAGQPVAMGYVTAGNDAAGKQVGIVVRGRSLTAKIVGMPFVEHRYHRG